MYFRMGNNRNANPARRGPGRVWDCRAVAGNAGSVAASSRPDIANDAMACMLSVGLANATGFLVTRAGDRRPLTLFRWIVPVPPAADVHHKAVVVRFFH